MGGRTAGERVRLAGVVRITTLQARSGQDTELMEAARRNAREARAASGCLSAEACTDPGEQDTVLVISRWESETAVRAFLDWHERSAHGALSPYAVGRPRSVHYPVPVPQLGTTFSKDDRVDGGGTMSTEDHGQEGRRPGVAADGKAIVVADWGKVVAPQDGVPDVALLHETEDLKVVLVALNSGQALPPHPGPSACFHILSGTGAVVVDGVEHPVSAGATVIAAPGTQRSVRATTPLVFIGNLGDPGSEDGPQG
jgi:quinol monooxygenase YgiN/quercetin dioxygenase-like cupin family protein